MMKLTLVILVAIAASSLAAPHSSRSRTVKRNPDNTRCATRCTGVNSKFRYEEGKSYDYKYEANTKVRLAGTSNDETNVKQSATVTISAVGQCEYSLKLSDVRFEGPAQAQVQSELEARALRFSFDDGLIREICPEDSEPAWVLNVKRGILSAFQNALEGTVPRGDVIETDINGRCPTKYETRGGKIIRTKDLISCYGHHGNYSALRGVTYDIRSRIQNVPLTDSKQDCHHTMERNILKEASCTETHSLKPFRSSDESGMIASSTQKLHFLRERSESLSSIVGSRKSLHFDHSEYQFEESVDGKTLARHNIRELCRTSSDNVRAETPAIFTELVYNLRKMSEADLRELLQETQAKGVCHGERDFFLDAVPMCGTENCVKLMVHVLKAKTLSSKDANVWLTSLSLVPKPTRPMVEVAIQLLNDMPDHAVLGVSSLVHGYCKQNPLCSEIPEVERFVQKLSEILGEQCTPRSEHETERIILALKAIGNVGHVHSVMQKLITCFQQSSNPLEVRLSAVQALRRMPCGEQKQALMDLFRNQNEGVELRLWAFMTAMKCPTKSMISELEDLLENEPVNQVSTYVWSYLKEKRSSNDPNEKELAKLLQNIQLSGRYNRDPRKYSRFYESGHFIPSVNLGGHAEGAWIFDPESYMPRQGFLNLTAHLFGTSINLLEIGGRAEGVDRLVEKLIGPDGYFTNPSGYYFNEQPKPHANSRIRNFQDLYTQRRPATEDLVVSLYTKVFGDELAYHKYRDSAVMDSVKEMMNIERLMEGLENLKQVDLNKNVLFLDTTITIPTLTGLPLRLAVNGTASLRVAFGAKMNVRQAMRTGNLEMEARVAPSAAIEISAMMAVQTRGVKSGVRMVTRLHTSTSTKGSLEIKNGQVFKAKLELPRDKMEIVDIQSQLFTITNNVQVEEQGIQQNKFASHACSPQKLSRWVGLKLCGELRYPNASLVQKAPYFPLTGPVRATITLEKADPALQSYELMTEVKNEGSKKAFKFEFNTPGSQVDRQVRAEIEYESGRSLTAQLRTPSKELSLEGTLQRTDKTSTGRLSLTVDKKETYAMTTTIQEDDSKYKVDAEVNMPGRETVVLSGNLQIPTHKVKRFAMDARLENWYSEPVETKVIADMSQGPTHKVNLEAMWRTPALHFDAKYAGGSEANGGFNYKFVSEYKRPSDPTPHKIEISQKQTVEKDSTKYNLDSVSKFESTWYPDYNGQLLVKLQKQDSMIETRVTLITQANQAEFFQVTRKDSEGKYLTEASLTAPQFKVDHQAKIEYLNRYPDKVIANVELDTPTMKDMKASFTLENRNTDKWYMETEAKLEWPGRQMRAFTTIEEVNPKEYKSNAILQWQQGKQIEIDTDVKLQSEHGKYEYTITSEGKISGQQDVMKLHKHFKMTPTETKYIGSLKRGSENIYDFKLDLVQENEKKTNIHSHFQTDYLNKVDYAIDGSMEARQRTSKVEFMVKKNRVDWLKGDFVVPTQRFAYGIEHQVKGQLVWELQLPEPKEFLMDYKINAPSQEDRTHDLDFKVHVDHIKYRWIAKAQRKGHQYTMNTTVEENKRTILKFDMGSLRQGPLVHPTEMALDFEFKTQNPLGNHHYSALLSHKDDDSSTMTTGHMTCHSSGNKLSFEASENKKFVGQTSKQQIDRKFRGNMNQYELVFEQRLEVVNSEQWFNSLKNGNIKAHFAWAQDKKINYESEFDFTWPIILKKKLTTPFDRFSEGIIEIELSGNDISRKYKNSIGWNKNRRISSEFSGKLESMAADFDAILETSFESLKKLESKVKYDFNRNWDLDAELKWNNENKAKVYHKKTIQGAERKVELGFESKVKNVMDWEGKLETEWDQMNYETEAKLRMDSSNWKLEGKVNVNEKTGQFNLETPYETVRSAKISVKKMGDNEYVIETEKNGEAHLTVSSLVKMEDNSHEIKFEVDKVKYPFALYYQGEFTQQKWSLKTELTRDPNKPTKATYGFTAADEAVDSNTRDLLIRIKHPKREVVVHGKRVDQWPDKYQILADFQPDQGSNAEPTKVEFTITKRPEIIVAELHLSDPTLPQGVKAIGKLMQSGNCEEEESNGCSKSIDFKLEYSNDPEKTLSIKGSMNKERLTLPRNVGTLSIIAKPIRHVFEIETNHPATDLHTKISVHRVKERCGSDLCRYYFESGIEYKNEQKEVKQYSAIFEGDKYESKISVKWNTPTSRWMLLTKPSVNHPMEWTTEISEDGEPVYRAISALYPNDRAILFEMKKVRGNSEEVLLHASAKLLDKDLAQVRLWHSENGRRIDDGEVTISLDEVNLLRTKFFIRPGLNQELQYAAQRGADELTKTRTGSGNAGHFYNSVYNSHRRFSQDFLEYTRPMTESWRNHGTLMAADLGPLYSELKDNLQLYWEMMVEFIYAATDIVQMSIQNIVDTVPSERFKEGYESIKKSLSALPKYFGKLLEPVRKAIDSMSSSVNHFYRKMQDSVKWIKQKTSWEEVRKAMHNAWKEVKGTYIGRKLQEWFSQAKNQLSSLQLDDLRDKAEDIYEDVKTKLSSARSSVGNFWNQWKDTMMEYELGRALVDFLQELYGKMRWSYDYLSPEDKVEGTFKWIRGQLQRYNPGTSEGWNRYLPRVTVNNPEDGNYEMEIPLPMEAHSLEHLGRVAHPDTWKALANSVKDTFDDYTGGQLIDPTWQMSDSETLNNVVDSIQGYQPQSWEIKDLSPPFDSVALLVGNQHFVTFDGRVFDFKANCKYLLARDFRDGKFTISADYGKRGSELVLEKLYFEAHGQEIQMTRRGVVKVDGVEQELPWQKMDNLEGTVLIQVVRKDHAAELTTSDGVKIRCDWYYHMCSIRLPGYFHGKSNGLLGTNDNEPSNDFMLPSGSRTENVEEFGSSWHVGEAQCQQERNVAELERIPSTHEKYTLCSNFFQKKSSPFRTCFKTVNPAPFMRMCEVDMQRVGEYQEGVACNISAAYLSACRYRGVNLDQSSECIQCSTPKQSLNEGQNTRIEVSEVPKSADVVFVVDEQPCMKFTKSKLDSLGKKIESQLAQKDLRDIRFGLIGFNGEGVHHAPHFHTGKNSIVLDSHAFHAAASQLAFEQMSMSRQSPIDPMVAMEFAATEFPFRPAVKKIVILMTCTRCEGRSVGYYDLQNKLLNNGIIFHMITNTEIELRDAEAENIIGLDAHALFEERGQEHRNLRSSLVEPHDSCTGLAQETSGTVFHASESKIESLVNVMSAKIGTKLSETSCQVCECQLPNYVANSPLTVCYPCEIPRPVSLTDGASYFNIPYLKLKAPDAPTMF